ncbi:YciI family protein [Sphingomonas canadensis]|uniref:YciI family protein n=1 Tax=Sphingomonas canadensis TaxID=1219257 RepID=A0ABW3HG00_9SPHN|nr:YciI family protein [Sphingomonas canadensis]MCW3838336.1 YciI family protein [Sphingomonas canadensis]
MPHYLVEYRELGNPAGREALRGDHIAYRKGFGTAMPLTGPLLGDDDQPVGSVVIIEAADATEAASLANGDPYVAAGVVELVSVRRYRIAAMKPPQA